MIMCDLSLLISLLLPFLCQDTLDYRVLLADSALVNDLLHATLQLGLPVGREQLHLLKPWLNRGVVFVAQGDGGRVTAWRLAVRSRSISAAAMYHTECCLNECCHTECCHNECCLK